MADSKNVFNGFQIDHAEIFADNRFVVMVSRTVADDWEAGIDEAPEAFAVLHDADSGKSEWLPYPPNNGDFTSATGLNEDGVAETVFTDADTTTNLSKFQFDGGHNGILHKLSRKLIRGVNAIRYFGSDCFACGRDQMFVRRTGPETWEQLHENKVLTGDPADRKHWNSMDGFAPNDIYLTGPDRGDGAVFHYDGKSWHPQQLPKELGSFPGRSIRCAPDGQVYALGGDGALIRGNAREGWDVLIHSDDSDIESVLSHEHMVWFKGQIYVTTLFWMYTPGDGKWEPYRAEDTENHPLAFGGLTTNGSVMLLYGEGGASLFDGEKWKPIYAPVSIDDLAATHALSEQLDLLEEGVDILRGVARRGGD